MDNLKLAASSAFQEKRRFNALSPYQQVTRLLLLFYMDCLSGKESIIFKNEDSVYHQNFYCRLLSNNSMVYVNVGKGLIIIGNVAMMTFSLLSTAYFSRNIQHELIATLFMWVFIEMLVTSSLVLFILRILLPLTSFKRVSEMKERVVKLLSDLSKVNKDLTMRVAFNSPSHFFVSVRLAKMLPCSCLEVADIVRSLMCFQCEYPFLDGYGNDDSAFSLPHMTLQLFYKMNLSCQEAVVSLLLSLMWLTIYLCYIIGPLYLLLPFAVVLAIVVAITVVNFKRKAQVHLLATDENSSEGLESVVDLNLVDIVCEDERDMSLELPWDISSCSGSEDSDRQDGRDKGWVDHYQGLSTTQDDPSSPRLYYF